LPGLDNAVDTVDDTRGDGARGLLVMMAFLDHQLPVDGGETRVDLASGVRSQVQAALETIAATLGQALSGFVDAAGGALGRKGAAQKPRMWSSLRKRSTLPRTPTTKVANVDSMPGMESQRVGRIHGRIGLFDPLFESGHTTLAQPKMFDLQ
jgi:hypothetical protein